MVAIGCRAPFLIGAYIVVAGQLDRLGAQHALRHRTAERRAALAHVLHLLGLVGPGGSTAAGRLPAPGPRSAGTAGRGTS
ncbi:hypothetical protein ACU686_38645 [Yinghuangia aomiensis]